MGISTRILDRGHTREVPRGAGSVIGIVDDAFDEAVIERSDALQINEDVRTCGGREQEAGSDRTGDDAKSLQENR